MDSLDCTWCGSARSIEYGVCQVCLMRFPEPAEPAPSVVIELRDPAETPGEPHVERPVAGTAAD